MCVGTHGRWGSEAVEIRMAFHSVKGERLGDIIIIGAMMPFLTYKHEKCTKTLFGLGLR